MHSIHYYFFSLTRTCIGRVSIVPGFLFSFLFFLVAGQQKNTCRKFRQITKLLSSGSRTFISFDSQKQTVDVATYCNSVYFWFCMHQILHKYTLLLGVWQNCKRKPPEKQVCELVQRPLKWQRHCVLQKQSCKTQCV